MIKRKLNYFKFVYSSILVVLTFVAATLAVSEATSPPTKEVQPFTGLVLWQDSEYVATAPIQLEFAYVGYDEVTRLDGSIDFTVIEKRLNAASKRGHQMILRFYDTYPGQKSHVPTHIIKSNGYHITTALSEGLSTEFPDWSNKAYQDHVCDIMTAFAQKYDKDPRVAYLQVGFGLWSEYHIYDGPLKLGETFPSVAFQETFLNHMDKTFKHLKWSISIDSADKDLGLFRNSPSLLNFGFGIFDDSFMAKEHDTVNRLNHLALDSNRYKTQPIGGELSYYTEDDQCLALSFKGVHGRTFLSQASRYHISYMIANDQPEYHDMSILKMNSSGLGYRFAIIDTKEITLKDDTGKTVPYTSVTVKNTGIAPIYYPAYLQIGPNKSSVSLEKLLPGKIYTYDVPGRTNATKPLSIFCERLLPSQKISLDVTK